MIMKTGEIRKMYFACFHIYKGSESLRCPAFKSL